MAIGRRVCRLAALSCAALLIAVVFTGAPQTNAQEQAVSPGAASDDAYDWAKWRSFWSFQPVRRPEVPAVKDRAWGRNAIDAFVLAKLEEKGLKPAPEADKNTLVRRATYDLIGLPPSPQEIRAFLADKSPDAYEKVIDRLLAS